MDFRLTVSQISASIAAQATPERAEYEKKYLKSDLRFLGARAAVVDSVVREEWKAMRPSSRAEVWGLCDALWAEGVHELRSVGLALLRFAPEFVEKSDLPKLRQWVIDSNGWAHVDTIAPHILGPLTARDSSVVAVIDGWATDSNFWVRRAAMLSMLIPLRSGDLASWPRFVRYATPQLGEKEFFIRKAIGWILRETSKKEPGVVFEFLREHRAVVSGLTLREGAKYLGAARRVELGLKPTKPHRLC